ncbi:TetR/AcrR family transcriptional regulator [Curtobacterium sp. ZW137]|uniref:TetR/AcrR family transcriptional regulator n=1 Tax=Curtobacterium sp. ZW137 TaxID=2485104 RepID=UPI000FC3C5B0|nr:TetR/AcrR family transcriptional regulator [Curtobacterium sp. ZW137]ROP61235.1 TetR family transcriptional regulator [Curtobacterium sp. ZW137]
MSTDLSRKLRIDAQENRDRILTAARELFAERGLDVGMREVARRAEVGPATLYRRFPTRQALIDEAFAVQLRTCRQIVEDGAADADPWNGFVAILQRLTVLNAENRGFIDAFMAVERQNAVIAAHRRSLLSEITRIARRAQTQGRLRQDFVIDDFVLVLLAGRAVATADAADRVALAQRFATLTIDAFRASPQQPCPRAALGPRGAGTVR